MGMADSTDQVALHGEVPEPLRGATPREAAPDPEERITVTVVVRSRVDHGALAAALSGIARLRPHERPILSPDEFERRYGAAPEDLAAVVAFAAARGLRVEEV